jgi:ParB/RepB/Spo0J family partition protein
LVGNELDLILMTNQEDKQMDHTMDYEQPLTEQEVRDQELREDFAPAQADYGDIDEDQAPEAIAEQVEQAPSNAARALKALVSTPGNQEIVYLPVEQLSAKGNVRTSDIDDGIKELAASYEHNGILEPIRVTQDPDSVGFLIESGQRRYLAALHAGLAQVPAIVVTHEDRGEALVKGLITNVQRRDLNPIDEAEAYMKLLAAGLTPKGIAQRVGVAQKRVTERMALLELPAKIVELFRKERLPLGARKALADIARVSPELAVDVATLAADSKNPEAGAVLAKEPGRVAVWAAQEKGWLTDNTRLALSAYDQNTATIEPQLVEHLTDADLYDVHEWATQGVHQHLVIPPHAHEQLDALGVRYQGAGSDTGVIVDPAALVDILKVEVAKRIRQRAEQQTEAAKQLVKDGKVPAPGQEPEPSDAERLKEFRRELRKATLAGRNSAHVTNLDLGVAAMEALNTVDVGGLDVATARLIAYGLIGPEREGIFLRGLRYCLPQFISEDEKGQPVYITKKGDGAAAITKWLDAAKKPGEYVGRALVALACAQWADQGAVPQSARVADLRSLIRSNHQSGTPNDPAGKVDEFEIGKVLEQFAKRIVPAALKKDVLPSQVPVKAVIDADPELAARA